MSKIYQNDVGTKIRLCCFSAEEIESGSTLYGADTFEIHVTFPTTHSDPKPVCPNTCGCDAIWIASAMNDPDYPEYIEYRTIDGDLAQLGTYSLQTYVEWGSSSRHHGDTYKMKVSRPQS